MFVRSSALQRVQPFGDVAPPSGTNQVAVTGNVERRRHQKLRSWARPTPIGLSPARHSVNPVIPGAVAMVTLVHRERHTIYRSVIASANRTRYATQKKE